MPTPEVLPTPITTIVPLSSVLAELRRVAAYDRIQLRGLNADEVRRMMSTISGQEVRWSTAEAVHRQTEGNPLFVQEVIPVPRRRRPCHQGKREVGTDWRDSLGDEYP